MGPMIPEEGPMKTPQDLEKVLEEIPRSGRQLEMLDLSQCLDLTDKHLEELTVCTGGLMDLSFPFGDKNEQLSDEAIRALLRANKYTLKRVQISFNQRVTETTLLLLAECPHLQVVILRDCGGRTDTFVQKLLWKCPITHLDVSDDFMSGSLYGRTSPLTNAAFTYIPDSLECLYFDYSQHLTEDMVKKLMESKISSMSLFGSKKKHNSYRHWSEFVVGHQKEWPTF